MNFLARLFAAFAAAISYANKGVREGFGMIWDDTRYCASYGAMAAGYAIQGPARAVGGLASGLGGLLSMLLPAPRATAQSVAEAITAQDDAGIRAPAAAPAPRWLLGELIREHAGFEAHHLGDEPAPLPRRLQAWIGSLYFEQRRELLKFTPAQLERHAMAKGPADRIPGIQPAWTEADLEERDRQVRYGLERLIESGEIERMKAVPPHGDGGFSYGRL